MLNLDASMAVRYENAVQSYTATCVVPFTGTPVTVTIPAGTYVSYQSQEIADARALAVAREQAEAALVCVFTYFNTVQQYTANCSPPLVGTPVTVIIAAGTYTSFTSQAIANALALAAATSQAEADLVCAFGNTVQQYTASCSFPLVGAQVTTVVPAGTYTSFISQAIANAAALAAATSQAESELLCGPPFFRDIPTLTVALTSGSYNETVVDGGAFGPDSGSLTVALTSGSYAEVVVNGGQVGPDNGSLTVALTNGSYNLVVVDGGQFGPGGAFGPDSGSLTVALTGGSYNFVLVDGGSFNLDSTTLSVSLTSGSYVLA